MRRMSLRCGSVPRWLPELSQFAGLVSRLPRLAVTLAAAEAASA
jgi:hypothetical protein